MIHGIFQIKYFLVKMIFFFFRDNCGNALTIVYNAVYRRPRLDGSPSMRSETTTDCFRHMYRRVHARKRSQWRWRLASAYIPSPITHYSALRIVRIARCTHCTWTTMHDSFLRSVTSDLYISGSYWPCARVSSLSLWSRDATQPTWCDATFCDSTADTGAHLCYAPHYGVTHHGLLRASPKERNVPRVQCRRSLSRLPAKAIVLFRSVRTPRPPFFMVDSWSSPRLLLFQSHLLESAGTFAGEGPFRCLRRSDSSLNCASRSRCAWFEPINFAMRRIPMTPRS